MQCDRPEKHHGHNESFNGKLRDELLNGEIFYTSQRSEEDVFRRRRGRQEEGRKEEEEVKISVYVHCVVTF